MVLNAKDLKMVEAFVAREAEHEDADERVAVADGHRGCDRNEHDACAARGARGEASGEAAGSGKRSKEEKRARKEKKAAKAAKAR